MADTGKIEPARGPRRPRRRVAWALAGTGALLLAAVATMDWWLPAPAARAAGAEFSVVSTRYSRDVEWRDLTWSDARAGVSFRAGRVNLDAPTRIVRNGFSAAAEINDWTLTVTPATNAPTETKPDAAFGWPELIKTLRAVGDRLDGRLSGARLKNGRVLVDGEEIVIHQLELAPRKAGGGLSWRGHELAFEVDLIDGKAWLATFSSRARLNLVLTSDDRVSGTLEWSGNTAALGATFPAGEWLPREFSLTGEAWRAPGADVGLGKHYAELAGDFMVRRAGGEFSLDVTADAIPLTPDSPPLKIAAAATGGPGRARLHKLQIAAPGLNASLSAPVEWRAGDGWRIPEGTEFAADADLGAWTAAAASGKIVARAIWKNGRVEWRAQAADGAWRDVRGIDADLVGVFWPEVAQLVVQHATVGVAAGTRLEGAAKLNFAPTGGARIEEASFAGEVDGTLLAKWLPAEASVRGLRLHANVSGPLAAPKIEAATVEARGATYDGWTADLVELSGGGNLAGGWAGTARLVRETDRGPARIETAGAWRDGTLTLESLRWRRGDGATMESASPAVITANEARLDFSGGGDRHLRVELSRAGLAKAEVRALDSAWLNEWRANSGDLPVVALDSLTLDATRDADGFWTGRAEIDAGWRPDGGATVRLRAGATADARGVTLGHLFIGRDEAEVARGAGLAPWRIREIDTKFSPIEAEDGEWALRLDSRGDAEVWDKFAALAGWRIENPAFALALEGPALAPRGRIELSAARLALAGEGLPPGGLELTEFQAEAAATGDEVVVSRLAARVDGQTVEASGRLPIGVGDLEKLRARPAVWLRDHAEARVILPEAKVAALARHLPTLLAPAGTVAAELALSPGARIDGRVTLRGGATRPLGDFGVLHDIDVDLVLAGMEARIERATARAGGSEIAVEGSARRVVGGEPTLELRARAERFPFVRKPGLILRGDLDLAVRTDEAGRTTLSGAVGLRDSLLLADIRPLISATGSPGGGAPGAARSRPPYFSVDTPPIADWTLALKVRGERFARIRTPVFEGRASASFDLEGTLRDPRVAGELSVDPGRILFPFATFTVQEGAVRVTRNDPSTARLDFRATGRRLGYDLRLELDGTADAPQLRLFSTPALDAETLLLMVTAGAAPDPEQTARGTQRLAAVGAYVGRDFLRTLGFAGSDEERLSIRTGEQVSRAGRETYGFEFRLDDNWSLTGEYDEFDAYNMGVRRRFQAAEPEAKTEAPTAREARP